MASVLHGSALMPQRIRTELKAAKAPARLLAIQYGLNVENLPETAQSREATDVPMGPKPKQHGPDPGRGSRHR